MGQQAGSKGKGACPQSWELSSVSETHMVEGENLLLGLLSDLHMCTMAPQTAPSPITSASLARRTTPYGLLAARAHRRLLQSSICRWLSNCIQDCDS